jgi:hypothetical protein
MTRMVRPRMGGGIVVLTDGRRSPRGGCERAIDDRTGERRGGHDTRTRFFRK